MFHHILAPSDLMDLSTVKNGVYMSIGSEDTSFVVKCCNHLYYFYYKCVLIVLTSTISFMKNLQFKLVGKVYKLRTYWSIRKYTERSLPWLGQGWS